MKRLIDAKVEEIEATHGRKLTNRQKMFARYFVDGTYSNAECARLAGYADKNGEAKVQAYKLLNPKNFPHVAEYVMEVREERERKYGVTLMGQLKRLRDLSVSAEESGQFSAAINAEKTRAALGGLTTDRRETNHFHAIENMSREEIEDRLGELRKSHPNVFVEAEYKVVKDAKKEIVPVEQTAEEDTKILEHRTD